MLRSITVWWHCLLFSSYANACSAYWNAITTYLNGMNGEFASAVKHKFCLFWILCNSWTLQFHTKITNRTNIFEIKACCVDTCLSMEILCQNCTPKFHLNFMNNKYAYETRTINGQQIYDAANAQFQSIAKNIRSV